MHYCKVLLVAVVFVVLITSTASALDIEAFAKEVSLLTNPDVTGWRYLDQDIKDGQALDLDDSAWKTGDPEFTWSNASVAWLRKTITIPEKIGAFPVAGTKVFLFVGVDDDGIIYVNGQEVQRFHWDRSKVVLTESAKPGERFQITIKGINTGGPGRLLQARLVYSSLEEVPARSHALIADLEYAQKIANSITGDQKTKFDAAIADAISKVDITALRSGNKEGYLQSLEVAKAALVPISTESKQLTCHLVGHAHIDMNWLWLMPETIDVCKNTFTSVTDFMEEFPGFKFSQSQPSTYVITEEHFPELYKKIQKYQKDGRWEITGGSWVEGDLNMSSGESIVRQILHAKRYFKEKFNFEPKIYWSPDTFGHAWTIPQILTKSDIKYYYFCRCGQGKPIFWWEGPDGSRVLAYNDGSYSGDVNDNISDGAANMFKNYNLKDSMVVYGVGDHGGGPTRDHLRKALELQNRTIYPTVKFSTFQEYMDTVSAQKQDFPVINGELNYVFQGCYTTHGDIKRMNRESENLLPTAEAFSVISSMFGGKYPSADFVSAWRDTCFNQFHDIFDGSAIHGSYDYSKELFEKATAKGNKALTTSLSKLAADIDTQGTGIPVVVFNPLSWNRTDVVRVANPFTGEVSDIKATDAKGVDSPCQNNGNIVEFIGRDIPSLGYKVYWLNKGKAANGGKITAKGSVIENEFFRITVDEKTGTLSGIYDKLNKREIVSQGKCADLLQVLMEKPHGMSAWDIGEISATHDINKADMVDYDLSATSVRARLDHQFESSTFVQDVILYDGLPRIDIKLTADWKEQGTGQKDAAMLKVAFPVNLNNPKASFEIPFGAIERPTDGREVPAQKWIDLSDDDYGVSLLNNCKYGHDVKDNVMRLTLLRSSYDPDPTPDQGIHEMTYSLYPHSKTWKEAGTVRKGYELNNPLLAVAAKSHSGKLPKSKSFIKVYPDNVTVTALKLTEDGDGAILRFYEWAGKPCTAKVMTSLPYSSYVETNLIERQTGEKSAIKDGVIELPVGKYEIKTVKLIK